MASIEIRNGKGCAEIQIRQKPFRIIQYTRDICLVKLIRFLIGAVVGDGLVVYFLDVLARKKSEIDFGGRREIMGKLAIHVIKPIA